jgi:hypothetical protein
MGHLTTESLARIVSEAPTPEEWEHLGSCQLCQAELAALKAQTDALGALPDLRPPNGDWETLEARLVSEGLVRSSGLSLKAGSRRWSGWLQAAAALILFVGGTAMGSFLDRPESLESFAQTGPPQGLELVPVSSDGRVQPASNLTEAAETVRLAERQYIDAVVQYRQMLDAQGEPSLIGDPTSRFAAVEAIVAAGRAAVQQAPADPFVNGVLVQALAERETILRNAALTRGDGVF